MIAKLPQNGSKVWCCHAPLEQGVGAHFPVTEMKHELKLCPPHECKYVDGMLECPGRSVTKKAYECGQHVERQVATTIYKPPLSMMYYSLQSATQFYIRARMAELHEQQKKYAAEQRQLLDYLTDLHKFCLSHNMDFKEYTQWDGISSDAFDATVKPSCKECGRLPSVSDGLCLNCLGK